MKEMWVQEAYYGFFLSYLYHETSCNKIDAVVFIYRGNVVYYLILFY